MRKIYYLPIIAFFAILLFNGCKKDEIEEPQNEKVVLGPNTTWIDENTNQFLQTVDSVSVVFEGNSQQLEEQKVGDIIVSGIADNAPYGYLRKITNITKNGSQYVFQTEQANFEETFEELHIDYKYTFNASDTMSGKTEALEFRANFPNTVLYDNDLDFSTTYDQVKFDGFFEFTPFIHPKIDVKKFKLKYAKLEAGYETVSEKTITVGGSLGSVSVEKLIKEIPLAPFTVPGTPVVVTPYFRISIGANGSFNVEIVASNTKTKNVSAYVEYEDSQWSTGKNKTVTNDPFLPTLSGTASGKIYIEAAVDYKFYDINWLTASMVAQGYIGLEAELFPQQTCEYRLGVSAGIEAQAQVLGFNIASVSYPDILDEYIPLYNCPTSPIANFSASSTNIQVGETVDFTDLSTNNPTTWSWVFQGESSQNSTLQNPSVTYNTPGTYQVSLIAANANGSDTETKTSFITVSTNTSNVYNGNVFLGTQTEVTQFGSNNYTEVNGFLAIGGGTTNFSINDLSPLSSISRITGQLQISSNGSLISLAGLENISEVGILNIQDNSALLDIDIFNNITSLGSGSNAIIIKNNPALEDISGINILTNCNGNFDVEFNDLLENITGFNGLNSISGDLDIFFNNNLINISGFNNLSSISGDFTLGSNGSLLQFNGLDNLNSISGFLNISSNTDLINIAGFNSLSSIGGGLSIQGNYSLSNISALSGINSLGGDLYLYNLDNLNNLAGLHNIQNINGELWVRQLDALNSISDLSSLNSINGKLYIYGNDNLTDISILQSLTNIVGDVTISANSILQNLDGLDNISVISGNLEIENNYLMDDLCGLTTLITNNGLSGSYSVSGNLYNPTITNIQNGNCN